MIIAYAELIDGDVGQDLVRLEVLKVSNNNLGKNEAVFANFITSVPMLVVLT